MDYQSANQPYAPVWRRPHHRCRRLHSRWTL